MPFGQTGGGIKNAIVGTIIMTGMATLIAVPVGVLIAIFNTEFAPPAVAECVRLVLNVLAGVPTIVIGIFIFGLLVVGNGQSAIAASVGLSIVMVPLIARATEEVLLLVPSSLREAGMALGATRARTVVTVILPTAVGGIVTATIVAVARAAGETAPLLFTSSIFANTVVTDVHQAMASIPLTIFVDSESPSVRGSADGMGGGARADGRRAHHGHHRARALAAHPAPDRAGEVSSHDRRRPARIGQDAAP